jgi:hypothetical protein
MTRLPLLTALAALIAAAALTAPAAQADVCTGGAPYQAGGTAPAALLAAAPILQQAGWNVETLPQWEGNTAFSQLGNQISYFWYSDTRLWWSYSGVSWWVTPGEACTGTPYTPLDCVMVAEQLTLAGYTCGDPTTIAAGMAPDVTHSHSGFVIAGLAPITTGSATVTFEHGTRVLPVHGGVYGGEAPGSFGSITGSVTFDSFISTSTLDVDLVDQTGIYSSSAGPLAALPRLNGVAAALSPHHITATILGTAVRGTRAHDRILYASGYGSLATLIAHALHAAAPQPMTGGALHMFSGVASVVVLVGRHN